MSRGAFVLLFFCIALTACATAPQVERSVQQASDALSAAREAGDAAAFAALFTDDGIFMVPGLSDAVGRAAVRELARKRFAGGRTEAVNVARREIEIVGDSAYELAWYAETDRREEQSLRMQGRHFILWKRGTDDAWRVHRYLYNFSSAEPVP